MRRVALALLVLTAAAFPGLAESQPITLQAVLRLAGSQDRALDIAAERVREARSALAQDRQGLFPWISPGIGYRRHDGNLQDVVGNVFDASKQSGTAAITIQAQMDLGESIYRVLASRQSVAAVEAENATQRRVSTLQAATAYTELSRAHAALAAAGDFLRIAEGFLAQIQQAGKAGLGSPGDVARAEVQREHCESLRLGAVEEVRLASVRLAQQLRLPMTVDLIPDLGEFVPVVLVGTHQTLEVLIAHALSHRSELRQAQARVVGAQAARDGTVIGPWLPTLGAQAAVGGMAGGRNADFRNGDGFQDYGLSLSWRIGPGGIGDRARTRTADSRLRISQLAGEQTRDSVTRDVIETRAQAETSAAQLAVATRAVNAARRLFELTHDRREFGVGAVLEAIDAEREFVRARSGQIQAVANHNRSQWGQWNAIGGVEVPGSEIKR